MQCEEVKKLIPAYIQHSASEEETKTVEEHLCTCHICREFLSAKIDSGPLSVGEKALTPQGKPVNYFDYIIVALGAIVLLFFLYLFNILRKVIVNQLHYVRS